MAPGSQGPSTLPPPPFESEEELKGLEWWLGAHMNLASSLLWLEQHHGEGAEPPSSHRTEGHLEAMRGMVAHAATVRDALYELYCDAADPRVEKLVSRGGPLEAYVRAAYPWCEGVVALLGRLSADLRAGALPDLTAAKATYQSLAALYPGSLASVGSGDALVAAVKALGIDFTSPVEPLRGLLHDIQQLLSGIDAFHATLTKRFE